MLASSSVGMTRKSIRKNSTNRSAAQARRLLFSPQRVAHEPFAALVRPPSTPYRAPRRDAGLRDDPRNGDRRICTLAARHSSASAIEARPGGESDARVAPLRWGRHRLRCVTHRHIGEHEVDLALEAFAAVAASAPAAA